MQSLIKVVTTATISTMGVGFHIVQTSLPLLYTLVHPDSKKHSSNTSYGWGGYNHLLSSISTCCSLCLDTISGLDYFHKTLTHGTDDITGANKLGPYTYVLPPGGDYGRGSAHLEPADGGYVLLLLTDFQRPDISITWAIQDAINEKKIEHKTERQIIDEVPDSHNRGHIAGVGRVVPCTGSSSKNSQVDQGFCTREELEEMKRKHAMDLQEQRKAYESQGNLFKQFVDFYNNQQEVFQVAIPLP